MYKTIPCLIGLAMLVLIFGCDPAGNSSENVTIQDDEKSLRYLKEVEWPKAYAEHDTLLLDRILGDDFQMIDQSGHWFTKKDELEWISEHATDHDSFRYEIKRLDILDNGTAVLCGTGHILKDSVRSVYQSSNVLIKRGDHWEAILSHVSGYRIVEE